MRRNGLAVLAVASDAALIALAAGDAMRRIAICNVYRRFQSQHVDEKWYMHSMTMSLECTYCHRTIVVVPRAG